MVDENVQELSIKLDFVVEAIRRMDETLNGTHDHGGLKERLAIAEQEITKNKEAYTVIISRLSMLESNLQSTLKVYSESIERMMPITQAVKWAGAIIGSLILALLWSLLTGKVEILTK